MLNKQEAIQMAKENILPFWQELSDNEYGGFYGEVDFFGNVNKTADKGCVLNSRILWTFSAAHRLLGEDSYKSCAANAKNFLLSAFFDKDYGGLYWLVDHKGKPVQTRKQLYNIAFGIYALGEHFLAFGDKTSLDMAMSLFDVLEKHGFDPVKGGYIEAKGRNWRNIDDYRLSSKDLNCPKSMNTNLHVLEALTTLLRAASGTVNEERIKKALNALLRITLEKIVGGGWNFKLFFDMNWKSLSGEISYGHDIEGSWLLYEAALALNDNELISKTKNAAISISEVVYSSAVDRGNGGFLSGRNEDGRLLSKREWWPQAEAVVGFLNAYELTENKIFFKAACGVWDFINKYFVDRIKGEWHNELYNNNLPDTNMPKAGFWKCPYHNARACFEIIKRYDNLIPCKIQE